MTVAGTHVVFGTGPAGRAVADTVYFCLDAPHYHWAEAFPPLPRAVVDAAKSADATTFDWYRALAAQPELSTAFEEATTLEVAA